MLVVYAGEFGYHTNIKTLEAVEQYQEDNKIENVLVRFIQVEKKDEEKIDKVETKPIKNLKWAAKKNNANCILLHSFVHLSLSKDNLESTQKIFNNTEKKLKGSGYEVSQTSFGYFLDLDSKAPGW